MQDSQILVLTKFNVRSKADWTRNALNPNWLSKRFELFEKFCLPSVLAQEDTDFTWVIFFDYETPEPFYSMAKSLGLTKNIKVIFTPPPDKQALRKAIFEFIKPSSRFVVTCRLDNDDGLALDYITRLRATACKAEMNTFINFRFGMILAEMKLYLQDWPDNAFCAFKELSPSSPATFQTVWNVPHTQIRDNHQVTQIVGTPAWLQVVHGSNVSNKQRGVRVHPTEIETKFLLSDLMLEYRRGVGFYWERFVMRLWWLTRDTLLSTSRRFR